MMDLGMLIDLVKAHEELYNLSHKNYSDQHFKEAAWRNIAANLDEPAIACRKAWVNLRDSFRRTIRKKKEAREMGKMRKKWRYEDNMSFLIPHFQEREVLFSDTAVKKENGDETNERIKLESYDVEMNSPVDSDDEFSQSKYELNVGEITSASRGKILTPECSVESLKYMDALDLFLANMAATIRKFPPYYQCIAKSKIFAAVSEIELNLTLKSENPVSQPTTPHRGLGAHFLETG